MRKGFLKKYLHITALLFILSTCSDPIFYTVSKEVAPIVPLISGGPTNFVMFKKAGIATDYAMYVASRNELWMYSFDSVNTNMKWEMLSGTPAGYFQQLASTDNYLYALMYEDGETSTPRYLYKFDSDDWEPISLSGISSGFTIQQIFAAKDELIIGATNLSNNTHAAFYLDTVNTSIMPLNITGGDSNVSPEICGVAFTFNGLTYNYFICTRRRGVFTTTNLSSGASFITGSGINLASMLNIDTNKIVAISDGGDLYSVTEGSIASKASINGRQATGALAIWKEDNSASPKTLLLAGRQESLEYSTRSGYTYGYVELELDLSNPLGDGFTANPQFNEPGNDPVSSVNDYERFLSTIGKHPVNHIFQAPIDAGGKSFDSNMTLFASTQKNGVWSYRERDGDYQWNAER